MKYSKFFYLLAMSSVVFAACGGDDPEKEPEDTTVYEAKITAAKFTNGNLVIEGTVYEQDKVIELACMPFEVDILKNGQTTAEFTISDGASITPDPATARDYTGNDVEFTVVSKKQEETNKYRVEIRIAEVQTVASRAWSLTYADLGLADHVFSGQSGVAFSGKNIVTFDGQVFDLDGKKVGTVNTQGVHGANLAGFQFVCVATSADGVFVATVGTNAAGEYAKSFDDIAAGGTYAWLDGWDKAPVCVMDNFTEANPKAGYMSVGGTAKDGNCILTHKQKWGTSGNFSFWVSSTGIEHLAWNPDMNSGYEANDGNWGQWICPLDGTVDGTFIIGDSNGNNQGYGVYIRKGKEAGNDVALKGTLATDGDGDSDHFGRYEYGNYSIGHVRGFTVFGTQYVAASTSGWPASYLTVQTINPDDEDHYLLRTQIFETSQPSPSSEFYYDAEAGVGYLAFIAQNYSVTLYEITQERI